MTNPVTTRELIGRRRLRASVDRTLGAKVPKAVFDEAEAYARQKMAVQNEALGLDHGVKYTELRPPRPFLFDMLEKPVSSKKNGLHYGYSWCGGCARWGTANKTSALDKHAKAAGKNVIQYIGIAADEQKRLQRLPLYKVAPLAKFGFTEADALAYCYDRGFFWEENGIRLYDVLDRVSCWCCANKNLKELRNIRTHLPKYWNRLKDLQSRTDRPMKGPGKSVFDLEERFGKEAAK